MDLIKTVCALALAVLLAGCANMGSQYDRDRDKDIGNSTNQTYNSDQTYNRMGDEFGSHATTTPGYPYGEQSSHYPPYYQSTR